MRSVHTIRLLVYILQEKQINFLLGKFRVATGVIFLLVVRASSPASVDVCTGILCLFSPSRYWRTGPMNPDGQLLFLSQLI